MLVKLSLMALYAEQILELVEIGDTPFNLAQVSKIGTVLDAVGLTVGFFGLFFFVANSLYMPKYF